MGADSDARALAKVVVPILADWIHPISVVEFGYGSDALLEQFAAHGATDLRGVAGGCASPSLFRISPPALDRRELNFQLDYSGYDLAISLNTTDELTAKRTPGFVRDLCHAASAVLFSASLPHMFHTTDRVSEWPSYWRALFSAEDYAQFDVVRPLLWNCGAVAPRYSQGIFLYASASSQVALELSAKPSFGGVDAVHPQVWHQYHSEPRLTDLARQTVPALRALLRRSR